MRLYQKLKITYYGIIGIVLISTSIIGNIVFVSGAKEPEQEQVKMVGRKQYGYARWVERREQSYLLAVASDYYTLGTLLGQNLGDKIVLMDMILTNLIAQYNIDMEQAWMLIRGYEYFIPEEYKQEMVGISDSIPNLSYDDVLLQTCFLDFYYGQAMPLMIGQMMGKLINPIKLFGCTAIGSKNKDGSVTVGQNMDFGYIFKDTLSFVNYRVKGKHSVFSLRMGSFVLPIGKSKFVYSTLTLVQTAVMGEVCTPISIKGRYALENSHDTFEYQEYMTTMGFSAGWNWIVGDKYGNLIGCESIPASYIETIPESIIVRTNIYVSEYMQPFLIDPLLSKARQVKAEELAQEEYDGKKIQAKELIEILSFNDGTDASICRFPPSNPQDPATLAFFSVRRGQGYFGLGNPVDNSWVRTPI